MTTEINKLSGNCKAFAEACFDQNSIEELKNATRPDKFDMHEWKISANEWKEAIDAALADKLEALGEE